MTINWYQYSQLLCLIAAVFFYSGLKKFSIAGFMPLLILINIVELVANNFKRWGWVNNYFVYNVFLILSTPIYLYLYRCMLNLTAIALKIYYFISGLTLLIILTNYLFIQGLFTFNSFSFLLISVLNIIFSCLILFKLSSDDSNNVSLFYQPYFWINSSNLLFNMITLVLLGLQQYILVNHIELENKRLYYVILPIANVALYLSYSYAFALCNIQNKKSS